MRIQIIQATCRAFCRYTLIGLRHQITLCVVEMKCFRIQLSSFRVSDLPQEGEAEYTRRSCSRNRLKWSKTNLARIIKYQRLIILRGGSTCIQINMQQISFGWTRTV